MVNNLIKVTVIEDLIHRSRVAITVYFISRAVARVIVRVE